MRRCLLVLAAAAAFDDVPFELRDVYGPPPAKAAVELPLLHEPRVKLWWPALDDVVAIAQDAANPYDAPTTLWPAGAVLAHALASDCASWQGKVILELGCGVGAAALALARCGASVVATDISEAALALTAKNTNGTNGTVVTRLLDWDDDDALRILRAVRKSMTAEARLLVLERVVGDARATDAHMWVCFGGKERSTAAFEDLLDKAGFTTLKMTPLDGDALVAIEAMTK